MISTNLSTRPFYNDRLVRSVLLALAVLVLAVTALNVWTVSALSGRDREQNQQAVRAEKRAADARAAAQRIRSGLDEAELKRITAEVSKANGLIAQRTFSWTRMFSDFERTLPAEVRITGVASHERDGQLYVDIGVNGRRAEDINEFVDRLEATGAFTDMIWQQETIGADGLRETSLRGRYVGAALQPRGNSGGGR